MPGDARIDLEAVLAVVLDRVDLDPHGGDVVELLDDLARPWTVKATSPAASTVSAQRGSSRRRASDSRRSASASRIVSGPAAIAVETGIACGAPAPVERIATVPGSQAGSMAAYPARAPGSSRMEDLVESLTRGNTAEVKVLLASIALTLGGARTRRTATTSARRRAGRP